MVNCINLVEKELEDKKFKNIIFEIMKMKNPVPDLFPMVGLSCTLLNII